MTHKGADYDHFSCDVGDKVRFFTFAHGWKFGRVVGFRQVQGGFVWAMVEFGEWAGSRPYRAHGQVIPAFQLERCMA